MATKNRQSKFYWHLSVFVLVLAIGIVFHDHTANAQYYSSSGYRQFKGGKFFLLTETSFSTDEVAKVRLEARDRYDLEAYDGVDMFVYKINDPASFLKSQRNLHRPEVQPNYQGEGIGNALAFLWDVWYRKSRAEMRNLFLSHSRYWVQKSVPEIKHTVSIEYDQSTVLHYNPQFGKLPNFELDSSFRYPIWRAKPAQSPEEVKLKGSNIKKPVVGNLYIPVGKKQPGLYFIEAIIGKFRATTLLFISDSVAVTKFSGNQMFVWTITKKEGIPSPNTSILITDGLGTIKSGVTDEKGVLKIEKECPDQSYLIGTDAKGGVFVSENFYYKAELYANKIYLFTDRPIYKAGERVFVKLIGREFINSVDSTGLKGDRARLAILDPNGTPIIVKQLEIDQKSGGNTQFKLPDFALSGGYTMQLKYDQSNYNGFFRVANFSKPHFEVEIMPAKKLFKTGEPITGQIRLRYANGDPVKRGKVEFKARSQKLTVVEGEINYLGLFPIQLKHEVSYTREDGTVNFELPPVTDPSRYVFRVRASDNTSYRVTSMKEILIHEGYTFYTIDSAHNFAKADETVSFTLKSHTVGKQTSVVSPASWEVIRLEDQSKIEGQISESQENLEIKFPKSGSYSILLKDRGGTILATKSFFVQGTDLQNTPGTIDIVLDKKAYRIGDTAKALITFSDPVQNVLLTLEKDAVSYHGLITGNNDWISLNRVSPKQWTAEIPINEEFSPNITFSAVYVRDGKYIFRNKGLKVDIPEIDIVFKTEKTQFSPGEKVTVQVQTSLKKKPVSSRLTIGLVDEMIYMLQREIAPDISDFFFHRRRNQVKTSSSLNFYTYDVATAATNEYAANFRNYHERPLKFREGSRREDVNTALWIPDLKTDEQGKASFSFTMPESITRWRLTARAITDTGSVGQKKEHYTTEKNYSIKWTGPKAYRNTDKPVVTLVLFNRERAIKNARFSVKGLGTDFKQNITLQPGSNYVEVPLRVEQGGDVTASLVVDNVVVDQLITTITAHPKHWKSTRSLSVPVTRTKMQVKAPQRAFNLRLSFVRNRADSFVNIMDNLIEYPYGCVEQTASKLIPLSIAYSHLNEFGFSDQVQHQLSNWITDNRFRLVRMAGPKAQFSWWGDMTGGSPFLTSYAYYADWHAGKALGINLPAEHWQNVLKIYRNSRDSLFVKSLILWQAGEMGLPIKSLVQGLLDEFSNQPPPTASSQPYEISRSYVFEDERSPSHTGMGTVLLGILLKANGIVPGTRFSSELEAVKKSFAKATNPLASALYLLAKSTEGDLTNDEITAVDNILHRVAYEMPTIDRSLSIVFLSKALDWKGEKATINLAKHPNWKHLGEKWGRATWQYQGPRQNDLEFEIDSALSQGVHARLLYDTYRKEKSVLPVDIERALYRLAPSESDFQYLASKTGDRSAISSRDLYVDEIRIRRLNGQTYKYGILEIPLSPGADLESPTYGMEIEDANGNNLTIEKARFVPGDQFYAVPIENLDRDLVIRNLVRFSQKGSFIIPRVRFYRMYNPLAKAFQEEGKRIHVN